jgi:feruloyl esterase
MNGPACRFDPAALQCSGADAADCLTAAQVTAALLICQGPRGPKGQIYPGAPYPNTTGWISFFTGMTPPPTWSETGLGKAPGGYIISHSFMRTYFGDDFDFVEQFDFSDQSMIDAYLEADARAHMSQPDANLADAEKAGRKILFWHGTSDHGIAYADMVRYFEELRRALPGDGRVDRFARLFPVPGVLHCGGGSGPSDAGPRALDKMIDWVEKGIAPENMVANRTVDPGNRVRQFLICKYPQVATYIGKEIAKGDPMAPMLGDSVMDANNWRCE